MGQRGLRFEVVHVVIVFDYWVEFFFLEGSLLEVALGLARGKGFWYRRRDYFV